ncbi:MAG: tol-pal system protein YbgF [Hyphomicrobiaceae bacterium]|nr:tol-pal system protein YbgF [Hyphomicrobiaceae bacterium]
MTSMTSRPRRAVHLARLAAMLVVAVLASAHDARSQGTDKAANLERKVDQLAEQLVDMQVVIGTLESLARSGGAAPAAGAAAYAPPAGGAGAADLARIDSMETQIRALTAQVEQLTAQVRALGGSPARRGDGPAYGGPVGYAEAPQAGPVGRPDTGGFGSTVVTPESAQPSARDPIGGFLASERPSSFEREQLAALPGTGGDDPKQLYEIAYGYYLQQDYASAETAFTDFLERHPGDRLAGSAQFWLGDAYYMRGNFKAAANAFLKGYETYRTSEKAPDSLLKLAMSLDRLGQKDAACSSFAELGTRFPNALPHVKNRAASERRRIGC